MVTPVGKLILHSTGFSYEVPIVNIIVLDSKKLSKRQISLQIHRMKRLEIQIFTSIFGFFKKAIKLLLLLQITVSKKVIDLSLYFPIKLI